MVKFIKRLFCKHKDTQERTSNYYYGYEESCNVTQYCKNCGKEIFCYYIWTDYQKFKYDNPSSIEDQFPGISIDIKSTFSNEQVKKIVNESINSYKEWLEGKGFPYHYNHKWLANHTENWAKVFSTKGD